MKANTYFLSARKNQEEISKDAQLRIRNLKWIPSPTLAQALKILQNDEETESLVNVIRKDPSLSLVILRVANGAFYGLRGRVDTVEKAIAVIGIKELELIVITVYLLQHFNAIKTSPSFNVETFWLHSFLTGLLARELAGSEDAYVYGLLHDVGRIAMDACLPEYFEQAVDLAKKEGISLYEAERSVGLTHTLVSSWIAARWGLPPVLRDVLAWHHEPSKAAYKKETAMIGIADELAERSEKQEEYGKEMRGIDAGILSLAGIAPDRYLALGERIGEFSEKAGLLLESLTKV